MGEEAPIEEGWPDEDLAHFAAAVLESADHRVIDASFAVDTTSHPHLAYVRLHFMGRPYVLAVVPGSDPPPIHALRRAAQAVATAVRNAGPAPGHHRAVLERTRNDWPVLMRAIDQLDRVLTRHYKKDTTDHE